MFSAQLLDHFQNPRNAGRLADADASVRVENPVCGDTLQLSLRIEDGRIAEIRFLAKGCVAAVACGSAVTELALAKGVREAREICTEDVVRAVGGLPEASAHAGQLAVEALRAALAEARVRG